jgi:hypothetical protein
VLPLVTSVISPNVPKGTDRAGDTVRIYQALRQNSTTLLGAGTVFVQETDKVRELEDTINDEMGWEEGTYCAEAV